MDTLAEPLISSDNTLEKNTRPLLFIAVTIMLEASGTLLLRCAIDDNRAYVPAFALYFAALAMFSVCIRYVPLSVAYATWCAFGTIGVSIASAVLFEEKIGLRRWVCILLTVPLVIGMHILP